MSQPCVQGSPHFSAVSSGQRTESLREMLGPEGPGSISPHTQKERSESYCKECLKVGRKSARLAQPERFRSYELKYKLNNAAKAAACVKRWYEANKERIRIRNKRFRDANPEKMRARYLAAMYSKRMSLGFDRRLKRSGLDSKTD
jgi:hypothetical protein